MPVVLRSLVARFSRSFPIRFLVVIMLGVGLTGCAAGKISRDSAYKDLKPKQQLPERELRDLPDNLIIRIDNVADAGKSYKNYVALFINGREVTPVEKTSNFTSTHTYPLRVQHGVYEVKAEYHVVGFWREQVFRIVPDEPVKVFPDQRTLLEVTLDKDYDGRLTQNPAHFRMTYEPVSESEVAVEAARPVLQAPALQVPQERPIMVSPAPLISSKEPVVIHHDENEVHHGDVRVITPAPEPEIEAPAAPENSLVLQINTSPSGADVIVDDRFYGQSPVKVAVTRGRNHVVQISRPGYRDVVKVLDAADLKSDAVVQLLIKMESAE